MATRVRVNLDNAAELRERLGLSDSDVDAIIRYRTEHGPIADGRQLESLLGGRPISAAVASRLDFAPSEPTAPEAPGA